MLEQIKLSMRILHNFLDTEIKNNIAACMLDLQRVGIDESAAISTSEDPLIIKAAELYCKWQHDYNSKGEQFKQAYENLRDSMSLCGVYTESEDADV